MTTATLQLQHERVDDIPLLMGFMQKMRLPSILEQHLGSHHLHEGLPNGDLMTVWLAFILSQASHCKVHVQQWANQHIHTLQSLLGVPLRPVECSDDRLSIITRRLQEADWAQLEADLWTHSCEVYEIPVQQCRLDATTTYGYHAVTDDGLMQYGHSKDHRPDLPQLKLMAAAALPSGFPIACDIVPGNSADDPLYLPLIDRVRSQFNRRGLLYSGDCKMAAIEIRADIAAHHDYYLVPLPHTGETQTEFAHWVDDALNGVQPLQSFYEVVNEHTQEQVLVGQGYEFTRKREFWDGKRTQRWNERVQIIRSVALAKRQQHALEERLRRADKAIRALTPPVGPGRRQIQEEKALQQAVAAILAEQKVEGLLAVSWERQETRQERYQGRGRGGPNRAKRVETQVRYQVTEVRRNEEAIGAASARLGWRVQVTNLPVERLGLWECVCAYNQGWSLERDFHVVKDLPLGIQPLYVRAEEQIEGMTRLLMIALRVLSLFELVVRSRLQEQKETLKGLYTGQENRRTGNPTATRLLKAVARMEITATQVGDGESAVWHLSSLPPLLEQILALAGLPISLYTNLITSNTG